jgi:hypothetical protein
MFAAAVPAGDGASGRPAVGTPGTRSGRDGRGDVRITGAERPGAAAHHKKEIPWIRRRLGAASRTGKKESELMSNEIERITPEEVRPKLEAGEALLVCAYEDDEKFRRMKLSGAISMSEFRARLPSLPRDMEIVFY